MGLKQLKIKMGNDGKSKKREYTSSPSPSSCDEDERSSKKHRKRDDKERKKSRKDNERKDKKRRAEKSHKHSSTRHEKDKKSKEKHKHRVKNLNLEVKELSKDDYFAKNNEFSTWLKEEKGIYFSDLSSEDTRGLFSKFVKAWNNQKLDIRYYEGIATAPRTAHNWKIKLQQTEK